MVTDSVIEIMNVGLWVLVALAVVGFIGSCGLIMRGMRSDDNRRRNSDVRTGVGGIGGAALLVISARMFAVLGRDDDAAASGLGSQVMTFLPWIAAFMVVVLPLAAMTTARARNQSTSSSDWHYYDRNVTRRLNQLFGVSATVVAGAVLWMLSST